MTEEFEALGIPMRQRGALTNECIAVMKELWTNPDPSYHSSRWHFSDLSSPPSPCRNLTSRYGLAVPVRSKETSGDDGDGGILQECPLGVGVGREEVRELASATGRDPDSLTMSIRVEVEAHGRV